MRVAQRAYLGFYFDSADVAPDHIGRQKPFHVDAKVRVKDLGNTPAYIDSIERELYAIDADDWWDRIDATTEQSPNYDPIGPSEPLVIGYEANFSDSDFKGDRSVVYRIQIRWHDAFNEIQPPAVYCGILTDVTETIVAKRSLSSKPCMKGMTVTIESR
jgi:hypothetical protein